MPRPRAPRAVFATCAASSPTAPAADVDTATTAPVSTQPMADIPSMVVEHASSASADPMPRAMHAPMTTMAADKVCVRVVKPEDRTISAMPSSSVARVSRTASRIAMMEPRIDTHMPVSHCVNAPKVNGSGTMPYIARSPRFTRIGSARISSSRWSG